MDWDKLRTFHIVAEAGSFTHAGTALDLSQSAVSRQISGLEESLGVKLFHRHARGLALTEAGELLEQAASDIFGKLAMAEAILKDSQALPSGTLRVTAPGFLGSTWLVPRLHALKEKYPDLQIHLLLDNRIFNLGMREADAAVRLYNVAIDAHLPLSQLFKIDNSAQGAADQALDFLRAAGLLATRGFAVHPVVGGARQHAVFRRHPAGALALQPGRHAGIDRRRAKHMRIAETDHARSFRVFGKIGLKRDVSHFVRVAA